MRYLFEQKMYSLSEGCLISFELESTKTEQRPPEPGETQTIPRIETPTPAPEIKRETTWSSPDLGVVRPNAIPQLPPSELSFVCILIPRFPDHHLAGDITGYLPEWMGRICISYGWRLDAVVVRPGYLHWIISTPLTVNPAQLMRLVRQHTSEKIFEEFPRFRRQNMSNDFWAPGYYTNAGKQLLTPEVINEFVLATRQQQGIF